MVWQHVLLLALSAGTWARGKLRTPLSSRVAPGISWAQLSGLKGKLNETCEIDRSGT